MKLLLAFWLGVFGTSLGKVSKKDFQSRSYEIDFNFFYPNRKITFIS